MKKWVVAGLAALFLSMPIMTAAAPGLSDKLFTAAKDAVSLIAYGEYGKAVKKLNFSKNKPDADEFEAFVEDELSDIFFGEPQKDVTVAYFTGKRWIVAIPVVEPSDDSVQTLVLSSSDGKSFDAYRSMEWGDVMDGVEKSDNVIWKVAYDAGVQYVIADN